MIRRAGTYLGFLVLVAGALACNLPPGVPITPTLIPTELRPTSTPTATATDTPILSPTPSLTDTPSATPSLTPSLTFTNTATATASSTASETPTPTSTVTPTGTQSPVPSATLTLTPTATPSLTATVTASQTLTPSATLTPLPTDTLFPTDTELPTSTLTATLTLTATSGTPPSPTELISLFPTAPTAANPTATPIPPAPPTIAVTGVIIPTQIPALPTATLRPGAANGNAGGSKPPGGNGGHLTGPYGTATEIALTPSPTAGFYAVSNGPIYLYQTGGGLITTLQPGFSYQINPVTGQFAAVDSSGALSLNYQPFTLSPASKYGQSPNFRITRLLWSPNGRYLLFEVETPNASSGQKPFQDTINDGLWIYDTYQNKSRQIYRYLYSGPTYAVVRDFAWTSDSSLVLIQQQTNPGTPNLLTPRLLDPNSDINH